MDVTSLALALALDAKGLTADKPVDLELRLELRNASPRPIEIYPERAMLAGTSGWGGPQWVLVVEEEGGASPRTVRELRTWYGPPGQPPGARYYEEGRVKLSPGETRKHKVPACWLPRAALPVQALTKQALDPEGMDGVTDAELASRAVLVIAKSCAALTVGPSKGQLRPGLVVFLPAARSLRVSMRYEHTPWVEFRPAASLKAESNVVSLPLGR